MGGRWKARDHLSCCPQPAPPTMCLHTYMELSVWARQRRICEGERTVQMPPRTSRAPLIRHSSALTSVCSPAAPESDRGWLKTVDSQTSCILIRRERRAGLHALRMTDVSAVPTPGWWGCGSHQGPDSLQPRLLSLTYFYSMVFPPPPPTLVLATATLATPQHPAA